MSKERLEEIHENKIMNIDGITDELQSIELTPEEYAYLIAHAGRVEELERVVGKQSQVILRQDSELDVMEQQSKRYRYTIDYLKLKLSDFHLCVYEIQEISEEKIIKDDADWLMEDISNTLRALEADK